MLRSLFHRTMKAPDPTCANATAWDRTVPGATIRSDLSRWRHGFEPRWDCSAAEGAHTDQALLSGVISSSVSTRRSRSISRS